MPKRSGRARARRERHETRAPSTTAPRKDRSALAWSALLIGLTLLAYLPALRAEFIWDDDFHITANEPLRTAGGIWTIWTSPTSVPQYYPFVHSLFWLEYRMWGAQPLGYHLVNILLHGLAAVLVWKILARMSVPGAWLAGAVFALHPVHVESVAWITERKNVLSGFLYLAALLCFVRYHGLDEAGGDPDPGDSKPRDLRLYAAGGALFLLALLSKTVVFSLPAAVLLLVWWKRGRIPLRDLAPQLPLLVLGGVFGLMTSWLEKHHVGAEGAEWSLSAAGRIVVAGRALWFYAGKLLWPYPLVFVYPRWNIDAASAAGLLFPIAFLAVVAALILLSGRIGRGPAAAVLFFAGTLFPALGFIDVYPMRYAYVADHFQYLASLGMIALGCALGTSALARARIAGAGAAGPGAGAAAGLGAAVLVVLGLLTWSRCGAFHDAETLWRETIAKNPAAWMAHDNLGLLLVARGEFDAGIAEYHEALAIRPDEPTVRSNLGIALAQKGDDREAIAELRRALEVDPDVVQTRYNLGTALFHSGDAAGAAAAFEEVVRRAPAYAQAHNNLALALRKLGRDDEAIEHYRAALRINPRLSASAFNLASALDAQGRLAEAAEAYASFLKLEPRDAEAESLYAGVLRDLGRTQEADVHERRARELSGAGGAGGAARPPAAGR